jgi:hypothetical protein
MKNRFVIATALVLCVGTAAADVITDWNLRAGQTIAAGARRGPSGVLDFPMVHLAMHDAVQSYERRFESYCAAIPNPSGSPVAAAAAAAHAVLVALFPGQAGTLGTAYAALTTQYIQQGLMVADDPGESVGQLAAACILGRLPADNLARSKPDTFVGGTGIGEWRPTVPPGPSGPVPMTADFIATFAPFAMKSPSQFRVANPPPKLSSGAYVKAYDEVMAKGASVNSTRTQDETDIARFFADAPPAYWNRLLRDLTVDHSLSLGDGARMFALVNMAMADAVIAAWDSKIAWNFWRPVTAIREGNDDVNPRTLGDPTWSPYFGTPNYPDYPSGATNLAGAATTMLENLLGTDDLQFSLFSNTASPSPSERTYTRLSDAGRDVVDARIFMGIHYRFADTTALRQGRHVANWAFGHFLRPVE